MEFKYFDVHSHIQDKQFSEDQADVIERMEKEVVGALVVGTDRDMSDRAVTTAQKSRNLWAVIGQHPTDRKNEAFELGFYKTLLEKDLNSGLRKIVGIGECGLDYFRGNTSPEEKIRQKDIFTAQIALAAEFDLPLMVHCRPSQGIGGTDAYEDCLGILKDAQKEWGSVVRGNIHFFAGNIDIASSFLDLWFTMSFTGVLTFTHDYDDVVRYLPSESILSETDCPYVTPNPYRGKRNEPAYISEVARAIARIRNADIHETESQLVLNARRVFNI